MPANGGWVVEAEDDRNGAEWAAESGPRLVRCVRFGDPGPPHALVLVGKALDRVRELHGRGVVQFQQAAPAKGREHIGQLQDGQLHRHGEIDVIHRVGHRDQVVRALRQGLGFGPERRTVRIDGAELFALDRRVARVGLALHPVAGGQQLPGDPAGAGHVPVDELGACQRFAGRGQEGALHRRRQLRLVARRRLPRPGCHLLLGRLLRCYGTARRRLGGWRARRPGLRGPGLRGPGPGRGGGRRPARPGCTRGPDDGREFGDNAGIGRRAHPGRRVSCRRSRAGRPGRNAGDLGFILPRR